MTELEIVETDPTAAGTDRTVGTAITAVHAIEEVATGKAKSNFLTTPFQTAGYLKRLDSRLLSGKDKVPL